MNIECLLRINNVMKCATWAIDLDELASAWINFIISTQREIWTR